MGAPLRFIHCADLHLGSRFVGVTSQDEGLGRRLSTATFDALENLVEAANREAVDFVLFSGDVFDSSNETPYARSRFADAVSRINSVCYIAYGNHDFRRLWEDVIPLPENAIVFGPEPEKRFYPPGPEAKVCITGVSHSRKAHTESLADGFEPESGFFNIGVVTNFLPATGISLPFFSYGGTALLLQLFEMGLILSVSRQSNNRLLL